MCIQTPNTGQLNPLFRTFAEFRLIVNRIEARQSTDWVAANTQFSPNASCWHDIICCSFVTRIYHKFTVSLHVKQELESGCEMWL